MTHFFVVAELEPSTDDGLVGRSWDFGEQHFVLAVGVGEDVGVSAADTSCRRAAAGLGQPSGHHR